MSVKRTDRSRLTPVSKRKAPWKKETDASIGAGKGNMVSTFWLHSEAKRWYILLGLSAIISILLFPMAVPPGLWFAGSLPNSPIASEMLFAAQPEPLSTAGGSIMVIINWLHYGDYPVAPLG